MEKTVNNPAPTGEAAPAPVEGAIPAVPPGVLVDGALALAAAPASPPKETRTRLDSIDLLRGLVMVVMLLDHTRDFFHHGALNFDPTDLAKTNAPLFLTRWVTHFCAPVFVFLAGTSAYLQLARGKSKRELSRFLLTRGLWLVVLEFTVVRAAVLFNFDYRELGVAQVIWAIGVSMIVLAALVHLPLRVVGALGVLMIVLHNLLDRFKVPFWQGPGTPEPSFWQAVWLVLHQQGPLPLPGGTSTFIIYPLIPWVGVMAAGYAFGALYRLTPERRRRILLALGASMIAAFVVLRAVSLYGDPKPWAAQSRGALFTVLSFLNVEKYPPSLLFLLMTLGPAIMALAWFERAGRRGPLARVLITFGRVPLFFYVLQWVTAHALAILVGYLAGQSVAWQFANFADKPYPNPNGFDLWVVYVFWAVGLVLLYPLCRWFAGVKQRRRDRWLSYL
ncbi:MAG TPA: heparan-alpha-glucosaminide N-acetyltransferase domain-containing protein [Pyrinomonadaceae bacterium]|nr:heparan-alpha-glucosaminide N-acetyltransferase domain-containing protein [Pyrinomonadaceae bacterium]